MKTTSLVRRGKRGIAAALSVGLIVAAMATLMFTSGASALTGNVVLPGWPNPAQVTVTPTTGLHDGDAVAVSSTFAAGAIAEMRVHICAHDANISNSFDFSFDGPYCTPNKLSPASDVSKFVQAPDATATSLSIPDFHVGTGTASWTDLFGAGHTLQCDTTHQCDLVVQFEVTGGSATQVFFAAPLTFAGVPTNPGAPTGVTGIAGDALCTVSWAAPADTGNSTIDHYVVTTTGSGAPAAKNVAGTLTSTTVSPLTNGQAYTFTVQAVTAAGLAGVQSAPSAACTPQAVSRFIHQHLSVVRPQGDLVLTQECAGSDIYPDDLSTVVYPTGDVAPSLAACTVDLGNAKLIKTGPGAGQYFEAGGTMKAVTVVDTRDTDPGWSLNGSVTDFTLSSDATKTFSGNDLGWTPAVPTVTPGFDGPDGHYEQRASQGGVVAPATNSSLKLSKPLATSAGKATVAGVNGGGLGIAKTNALLKVWIPIFAQSGSYSAVLTITAI